MNRLNENTRGNNPENTADESQYSFGIIQSVELHLALESETSRNYRRVSLFPITNAWVSIFVDNKRTARPRKVIARERT